MAELAPTKSTTFNYKLRSNEEYSQFQVQALKAMNWKGLILPKFDRKSQTFTYNFSDYVSLEKICGTDSINSDSRGDLLKKMINHCSELWQVINSTQLIADNILFDPQTIFFPKNSLNIKESVFLYLPIWNTDNPKENNATVLATESRLGLVELYIKSMYLPDHDNSNLINAAAESIAKFNELIQSYNEPKSENLSEPTNPIINSFNLAEKTANINSLNYTSNSELKDLLNMGRFEDDSHKIDFYNQTESTQSSNKYQLLCILLQILYFSCYIFLLERNYIASKKINISILAILIIGNLICDIAAVYRSYKNIFTTQRTLSKEDDNIDMNTEANNHLNFAEFGGKSINDPINKTIYQTNSIPKKTAFLSRNIPGSSQEKINDRAYLLKDEFIIGSNPLMVDYLIPCDGEEKSIARITNSDNEYYLTAMTREPIFINGKQIKNNIPQRIPGKSTLKINNTVFYFYSG